MCGRFTLTSVDSVVEELGFFAAELPEQLSPRYNIAPTQSAAIIASDQPRSLVMARWGLVPSWAQELSIGARMINARLETLREKPAFRAALAHRRCLVVADGFYEWKRVGAERIPHYVRLETGKPFTFAGLWERWRAPRGEWIRSFTIITGDANELMAPIHDRMPVIVSPGDYARWLDPALRPDEVSDILVPPSPQGFELYEVSRLVNSVKRDLPALIEPCVTQGRLFD